MKNLPFTQSRRGQTALIITLVVVVGLTVAVAALSRSVTSVTISTQEEEQSRSFSAAEAGIEDALRRDLGSYLAGGDAGESFAVGDSTTSYSVTKLTNVTARVDPGQTVTIDWSNSSGTQADVDWSESCANLVSTVIDSSGNVEHDVTPGDAGPVTFRDTGSERLVRLRFVGCSTQVTISGNDELAFYEVDSTGTSGGATSKVQVIRSEPAAIGLFDFAVFSGGDIK